MKNFEPKSGMIFKFTSNGVFRWGLFVKYDDGLRLMYANPDSGAYERWGNYDNSTHFENGVTEIYEGMNSGHGNVGLASNMSMRSDGKAPDTFGKLLWSKEKDKVELTLQQIADKFGIEVEQVRIKDDN